MKEVTSKIIDPSMKKLLSFATSESKVEKEYEKYIYVSNRKLYQLKYAEYIVGCIGIEISNLIECEIKHIAVYSDHRSKGIGSQMIHYIASTYKVIHAETDKDAVDFYRKYGFKVTSLGEKYPGVERFLCTFHDDEKDLN